jgi:hypothetical protein
VSLNSELNFSLIDFDGKGSFHCLQSYPDKPKKHFKGFHSISSWCLLLITRVWACIVLHCFPSRRNCLHLSAYYPSYVILQPSHPMSNILQLIRYLVVSISSQLSLPGYLMDCWIEGLNSTTLSGCLFAVQSFLVASDTLCISQSQFLWNTICSSLDFQVHFAKFPSPVCKVTKHTLPNSQVQFAKSPSTLLPNCWLHITKFANYTSPMLCCELIKSNWLPKVLFKFPRIKILWSAQHMKCIPFLPPTKEDAKFQECAQTPVFFLIWWLL